MAGAGGIVLDATSLCISFAFAVAGVLIKLVLSEGPSRSKTDWEIVVAWAVGAASPADDDWANVCFTVMVLAVMERLAQTIMVLTKLLRTSTPLCCG